MHQYKCVCTFNGTVLIQIDLYLNIYIQICYFNNCKISSAFLPYVKHKMHIYETAGFLVHNGQIEEIKTKKRWWQFYSFRSPQIPFEIKDDFERAQRMCSKAYCFCKMPPMKLSYSLKYAVVCAKPLYEDCKPIVPQQHSNAESTKRY